MNELNWAANYRYTAQRLQRPETLEQLQELVRTSRKVKALGSRHSFNHIADTSDDLISLERMDRILELDPQRRTVTVEGGVRYGPLAQYLHREGYALHNMASLPHISVVGACATATHGSGDRNGNLASKVVGLQLVSADGELHRFAREHNTSHFDGLPVHLGALGIITQITLEIEPSFDVQQDIFEQLPLSELEAHFDEIMTSAYSVSLFTDWWSDTINQLWLKRRIAAEGLPVLGATLFGAKAAARQVHPIVELPAEPVTTQLGVPGPWCDRLPHFRMEFTPSSGEELQSEYFVTRRHALDAIHALNAIRGTLAPLLQISEIRSIAADTLWMSPCYQQDSIAFHFTWKKDWDAVRQVLPQIESVLEPFNARPHWGKLFTMDAEHVQSLYERLPDFQQLMQRYDPEGKFRNPFLEEYIGLT